MTPLNWAVLIVGLGAAVIVWWVSRRHRSGGGEWIEPKANDKQMDMFTSTGQFDEFGVGKPRRVAPSLDGAPTASQAARGESPQKIVAFLIAEREGTHILGPQIHAALEQHGLSFGSKQIYHRHAGGEAVFSVASLLKPGFIDPAEAATFSTPGLSVFMVLPGPLPAMTAFREMLSTTQNLAAALNAGVYDMRRKPLTPEATLKIEREVEQWARANPMR
jgi:cell division protein ZipA